MNVLLLESVNLWRPHCEPQNPHAYLRVASLGAENSLWRFNRYFTLASREVTNSAVAEKLWLRMQQMTVYKLSRLRYSHGRAQSTRVILFFLSTRIENVSTVGQEYLRSNCSARTSLSLLNCHQDGYSNVVRPSSRWRMRAGHPNLDTHTLVLRPLFESETVSSSQNVNWDTTSMSCTGYSSLST